jgi:hypothetical protein
MLRIAPELRHSVTVHDRSEVVVHEISPCESTVGTDDADAPTPRHRAHDGHPRKRSTDAAAPKAVGVLAA